MIFHVLPQANPRSECFALHAAFRVTIGDEDDPRVHLLEQWRAKSKQRDVLLLLSQLDGLLVHILTQVSKRIQPCLFCLFSCLHAGLSHLTRRKQSCHLKASIKWRKALMTRRKRPPVPGAKTGTLCIIL